MFLCFEVFLASGNTLRQWDIASNFRFSLVEKLSKAGIQIAGPSIKILMKNNPIRCAKIRSLIKKIRNLAIFTLFQAFFFPR